MTENRKGFGDLEPVVNRMQADIGTISDAYTKLMQVRATILVNAVRGMGCSNEEAHAYADGTADKPFITAMCEYIENRHREEWKTIDTAPRDGTRFMAFEKSDEYSRYECWWQDDFGHWEGWQNDWDNEPNPTHWKPLDPEPETRT